MGRRGYLGLLGAAAGLAAMTTEVRAASVVNLGEVGLSEGDRIDPYIDEYLETGVRVVVPKGTYEWDGSGLHGKTFDGDAALVGDGQVTLRRVNLPNHTNIVSNRGTFRMANFTIRGDAGTGSSSNRTRIRGECESRGTIEFVNVRQPDGTRDQSQSEAKAWYVPGAHAGTIRFIGCEVAWFGNNGIYASSPGHGRQGTVEVIGGFFYNNNIASIRVGGDDWLIKDAVIVHDQRAPSRIESGTRMRGIRIDEGGQNGRIENVHLSVFDSVGVASPPLENSRDSSGGSCTVQDFYIYNETRDDCIDLSRGSYDMVGDNLHLTGSGNLDYDGNFSNVCAGDSCQRPNTEEIDGDGSSDPDSGAEDEPIDGSVVEVVSVDDSSEFDYEFDADGPVVRDLDAGDRSAEVGNDDIYDNGDGTYTVSGHTGFGSGDTFIVDGDVLDFRSVAAVGTYAVFIDGEELTVDGSPKDDEPTGEAVVEVVSTDESSEFDYTFVTDGPVTRVLDAGDRSAETGNDEIVDNGDGTYSVNGHTGFGNGDTFTVGGDLLEFGTAAAAGTYAVYVDGDLAFDGDDGAGQEDVVVEVVSTNESTEFGYEFDADGPITRDLGAGDRSAETGNDTIIDNGDGTFTVSGQTGLGNGDTFTVAGDFLDFRTDASSSEYAVYVDGKRVAGGVDDGSNEVRVEVLSTDASTEFDYTIRTTGPASRVLDAGDRSAETGNDAITENGDGTYTITGRTGFGKGDTFIVEGELVFFAPEATPGECEILVDGSDVSDEYLLPNRFVIDGSGRGRSQYAFEVSGNVAPASALGELEPEDTIDGSVIEGEVDGDVDAYYFSGDVIDYRLRGGASVVIEDVDD